jgi:ribitol 2-dehydrogenase
MPISIAGKTALVTGASSGIGRAAARMLAAEGVRVSLAGRSDERLRALQVEIGPEHPIIVADLSRPEDVDRMAAEAEQSLGRIDILFANAGLYVPGNLVDGDTDQFDRMLSVNVNSVVRVVRAVLPGMIARGSGDVVVTSSISGHQALHWEPVYSASKHAVQAFVHGVRRQVSEHGVRVSALAPGMVLNELWGPADPEEVERKIAARAGLRSEDVADALLFMLTRPPNVTVRDLVLLPQNQDI